MKREKQKILVTGGSGFIGTQVVHRLLARGHSVRVFDKVVKSEFSSITAKGDVRDLNALRAECKGIDVVVHLAAEHRDDVRPDKLYFDVNVEGTRNLVSACAEAGVNEILFTSSVAVYGLNVGEPTEISALAPFNNYGRSKLQAEEVLQAWTGDVPEARKLIIVRPVVVFGEGNRGNVYNLCRQIASGAFVMIGDGSNRKSMAYVENIADFLCYCLENTTASGIFNYADKPDLSTQELVTVVSTALCPGKRWLRIPYALALGAGYLADAVARLSGRSLPVSSVRVKKFCADTVVNSDKSRSFGFTPASSLAEGLRRMVSHEFRA